MLCKREDISRRKFLTAFGGAGLMISLGDFGNSQSDKRALARDLLIYIGTYTSGGSRSEGIYIYKLNTETGALSPYRIVKSVEEPSFLAIDKSKKYLYAVNETVEYRGRIAGR